MRTIGELKKDGYRIIITDWPLYIMAGKDGVFIEATSEKYEENTDDILMVGPFNTETEAIEYWKNH